ncbi:restriction endonuclease subunit S [Helcococcus ovis]|uniref:restriction endonuclease subunit S n=1 Tax=Helcococcus ovis TaxID=72026 RepID=UPI00106F7BC3|nr:restriction endonuclease subunit S [Helcococcus ovis]TFF65035.1 restriction endonuclease subunit S [Helcococcus ovis]
MAKKKRIPEIRFDGFEEEWEEKRLGEIAEINPKSILPNDFKYVDLESVEGSTLVNSRVEHINTAPSRAQRLAEYGDIFYQTVRPYQKNNFLFDIKDNNYNYVFSTGYAQLRTVYSVNNDFLFQSIQLEKFVNEVMLRCTGTSYPAINSTELSKIKLDIPKDKEESKQIGYILNTISNIINTINERVEKLKNYKQSMLQKMFPKQGEKVPEIRFEGFEGEWEEKKLSEVSQIKKGKQLNKEKIAENGKYYHLNGGILPSNRTNLWNSNKNTISISEGGENCGYVKWNNQKFFSGGT